MKKRNEQDKQSRMDPAPRRSAPAEGRQKTAEDYALHLAAMFRAELGEEDDRLDPLLHWELPASESDFREASAAQENDDALFRAVADFLNPDSPREREDEALSRRTESREESRRQRRRDREETPSPETRPEPSEPILRAESQPEPPQAPALSEPEPEPERLVFFEPRQKKNSFFDTLNDTARQDPFALPELPLEPESSAPQDPFALPELPLEPESSAPQASFALPELPLEPESSAPQAPAQAAAQAAPRKDKKHKNKKNRSRREHTRRPAEPSQEQDFVLPKELLTEADRGSLPRTPRPAAQTPTEFKLPEELLPKLQQEPTRVSLPLFDATPFQAPQEDPSLEEIFSPLGLKAAPPAPDNVAVLSSRARETGPWYREAMTEDAAPETAAAEEAVSVPETPQPDLSLAEEPAEAPAETPAERPDLPDSKPVSPIENESEILAAMEREIPGVAALLGEAPAEPAPEAEAAPPPALAAEEPGSAPAASAAPEDRELAAPFPPAEEPTAASAQTAQPEEAPGAGADAPPARTEARPNPRPQKGGWLRRLFRGGDSAAPAEKPAPAEAPSEAAPVLPEDKAPQVPPPAEPADDLERLFPGDLVSDLFPEAEGPGEAEPLFPDDLVPDLSPEAEAPGEPEDAAPELTAPPEPGPEAPAAPEAEEAAPDRAEAWTTDRELMDAVDALLRLYGNGSETEAPTPPTEEAPQGEQPSHSPEQAALREDAVPGPEAPAAEAPGPERTRTQPRRPRKRGWLQELLAGVQIAGRETDETPPPSAEEAPAEEPAFPAEPDGTVPEALQPEPERELTRLFPAADEPAPGGDLPPLEEAAPGQEAPAAFPPESALHEPRPEAAAPLSPPTEEAPAEEPAPPAEPQQTAPDLSIRFEEHPAAPEPEDAADWDPLALFGSQTADSELPTWAELVRSRWEAEEKREARDETDPFGDGAPTPEASAQPDSGESVLSDAGSAEPTPEAEGPAPPPAADAPRPEPALADTRAFGPLTAERAPAAPDSSEPDPSLEEIFGPAAPQPEAETVPMDLTEPPAPKTSRRARRAARRSQEKLTLEDFLAAAVPMEQAPAPRPEPRPEAEAQTFSAGRSGAETISTARENPDGLVMTWTGRNRELREAAQAADAARQAAEAARTAAGETPRRTPAAARSGEPVPSADVRREPPRRASKPKRAQRRARHDEMELLPPEEKTVLQPEEAYRVYARPLDKIGSQLVLTGLFTILSLFFTLYLSQGWTFLPEIFSGGATVYVLLALLGLMVLVNRRLYFRQWRDEFGLRPELLLLIATFFTAIDCFSAARSLRPPFTVVVGALLMIDLWGRYDRGLGLITTVKVLRAQQLSAGVSEVQDITKGSRGLTRTEPDVERFMEKLETRDLTDRLLRVYTPVAALGGMALTLLISLTLKRDPVWTGSLIFLGSVPVTGLLAFPRLFCLLSARLSGAQAALCGYHGAEAFGGEHSILIGDDDIFPQGSLTLNGFKVYSGNPDRIIAYAAAACRSSGSALDPVFEDLLVTHNGRHYSVDNFRFYDSGGIGASIQQDVVLMGSLDFMRRMGVHMDRGARVKQAVYMSLNGELAAVFAVRYAPPENLRKGLAAIAGNRHFKGILVTRTFLGTPSFLKAKFGIPTGAFHYPSTKERIRLSEAEMKRSGAQGAILAKDSFSGFAQAAAAGRLLRSATLGAAALTVLGGLVGIGLMGVLAALPALETATALNLLLYTAAWLAPTLLLTAWGRHF